MKYINLSPYILNSFSEFFFRRLLSRLTFMLSLAMVFCGFSYGVMKSEREDGIKYHYTDKVSDGFRAKVKSLVRVPFAKALDKEQSSSVAQSTDLMKSLIRALQEAKLDVYIYFNPRDGEIDERTRGEAVKGYVFYESEWGLNLPEEGKFDCQDDGIKRTGYGIENDKSYAQMVKMMGETVEQPVKYLNLVSPIRIFVDMLKKALFSMGDGGGEGSKFESLLSPFRVMGMSKEQFDDEACLIFFIVYQFGLSDLLSGYASMLPSTFQELKDIVNKGFGIFDQQGQQDFKQLTAELHTMLGDVGFPIEKTPKVFFEVF